MANRKRIALKTFRVSHDMTQDDIAKKLNYSLSQYSMIERGTRDGTQEFWNALQRTFSVPDSEMWKLTRKG